MTPFPSFTPYGIVPNYAPQPEPIEARRLLAAKTRQAEFISTDGDRIFRERYRRIEQADWSHIALAYGSWWQAGELPNDVIDLGNANE